MPVSPGLRPPDGPLAAVFSVLTDEAPPRVSDRRPRLMARLLRIACLIAAPVAATATLGAVPATAQFFNPFEALFGAPPRPPSSVPSGRIISFDAAIGETVQFGALQVTPRACYTRPATEASNTDAFLEVDEVTLQGEIKRIFTGWMFASSPGLHAVEHPIYDVWLTDCKNPVVAAAPPPDTSPASAAPAAKP